MARSRWAAIGGAIVASTIGAGPAGATTISGAGATLTASAPILGDVTNGAQTAAAGLVGGATTAVCTVTGDETVCTLTVLSYGVATDYVRPDGTHVVRMTGGVVNVPTLVDATGDGFPDVSVNIRAISTGNIEMTIERLGTAPATMPVSVEAVVNDPSTEGRRINVGYDARETTAPGVWHAHAALTTGTTTSVDAALTVEDPPASMAAIGGLFTDGPAGARLNPKQARLNYTPVPSLSNIAFSLGEDVKTGTVSASSPTTAELELLLLDGTSGQHVLGTLDKLRQPVGLLLDEVDGNAHVRLTTFRDVQQSHLTYETITNGDVRQRVRLDAGPLPGQTDFTQTANGFVVDTSEPITDVSGGVASSEAALPDAAPVESDEPSYVHQDTTGGVASTTFRVAGVEHVAVETTGAEDDRRIAIGARLQSAPLHVLVTNDAGTRYDATVEDVPHNFFVAIAPARVRMLDFCGSSSQAADPCSAAGQESPAGIERITLHDSYSAEPLFGDATHINGRVEGIPSTLGLDIETRAPVDESDPDQNTKVHIDTTRAIGHTILRATDGSPAPADPADNGLVYIDRPDKFAVIAKVDGFRRAHLDTSPQLALELTAAGGHDFSYLVDMPPKHIDGAILDRPANTKVSLASPEGQPTTLKVSGADTIGFPAATPKLLLNLRQPEPLFGRATSLATEVTDIPSSLELTIDSRGPSGPDDPDQNTKVHVDANRAIGQVIIRATDGQTPPADPADNGVVYQDQEGEPYAVIAKVDGFRSMHLDTSPRLDVALTAAPGHDLSYGIHLPAEEGKPQKDFTGVAENRPATTRFYFENPAGGEMRVHAESADEDGNPAPTDRITLDALHLEHTGSDEKIHNVRVDLRDVPPALDLVKQPTPPDDDTIDIDVSTTGGPLGEADVKLDNDHLPAAGEIPALPADGGGAIVFSDAIRFYMHAHIKQLRSVSLRTKPQLDAALDVAEPQDFRVYLNTGLGSDSRNNEHQCEDFDPDAHNKAHVETHDVLVEPLQPNTEFHFVSGDDGGLDPCKVKSWRTIEYSADGRADRITYDTNVGDMAKLEAVIGRHGDNPLQVPRHLKVCQASDDECFDQINRRRQCNFGGIDYDYCSLHAADVSVYAESFGEKTHMKLDYCALNLDRDNFSSCTRTGVEDGIFVDLNAAHVDMGFNYDDGQGFLTVNSQKHTADGSQADGPNLGVNGFVKVINHRSIAEYINLNFGYDDDAGPAWEAPSTRFDNSFGAIVLAAPLVGSHDGVAECISPAYGPTWDEADDYFHVILDAAGNGPDDLGDNLTNLLCGLF